MARRPRRTTSEAIWLLARQGWGHPGVARFRGGLVAAGGAALVLALATYNSADPSFNAASSTGPTNLLGVAGALAADTAVQSLGLAALAAALVMVFLGLVRAADRDPDQHRGHMRMRALLGGAGALALAGALAAAPRPSIWPLARGLGGLWGDGLHGAFTGLFHFVRLPAAGGIATVLLAVAGLIALGVVFEAQRWRFGALLGLLARLRPPVRPEEAPPVRREPVVRRPRAAEPAVEPSPRQPVDDVPFDPPFSNEPAPRAPVVKAPVAAAKPSGREARESQTTFEFAEDEGFALPQLAMLAKPKPRSAAHDEAALRQNAKLLEGVLAEFGVRGTIDSIRAGPVVTLYELVPAAGVKSARVIALAEDIARSMSVIAARVAVVPGRNAIGIELPNAKRETVYLRDLLSSADYERAGHKLPMALGETIGGEPCIADLGGMPHLLIAGTTGSGKSVGVNAMILSILYRLTPEQCRFIMIDPKMLELSVYDGIPHLLTPVVTDPKKAIVALKWAVREMENRYRQMSKIGVRNIGGYNDKAVELAAKGEHFERTVQTGFDEGGRPIYETEKVRPEPMPYIVVVIDEVADLMLVAGKDIEGAVQRLAQMARAAGIHVIMATQRPSVDVITGTIKANFPTRISFQVTSKIDSRTILGEQGAEQLLGMGDMLYMEKGGRTVRLHGPFVSDGEVEAVANFLREQGEPQYLEEVTVGDDDDEIDLGGGGGGESAGNDLYDQAVAIVTRDGKASTSYVQRRLQIGYNRAASLIERMEREGVVSAANHAGKREILARPPP